MEILYEKYYCKAYLINKSKNINEHINTNWVAFDSLWNKPNSYTILKRNYGNFEK